MLLEIEGNLIATIISSATMLTIVMSYFAYRIVSMMVSHYCETSSRDQKYQMFRDNRPIITNFVDDCKSKLFGVGVYLMGFRSVMSLAKCFMKRNVGHNSCPFQETLPIIRPCPDTVRVKPFDFIRNKPVNPFFDMKPCSETVQMKPMYDFGGQCPDVVRVKPMTIKNPFEMNPCPGIVKNPSIDIRSPIEQFGNLHKHCPVPVVGEWFDSEIKVDFSNHPEPFDPSSEKWSPFPFEEDKAMKEGAIGPIWGDLRGHPLGSALNNELKNPFNMDALKNNELKNPYDMNELKPQNFSVFPKEIPVVQPVKFFDVRNVQQQGATGAYQPKRTNQNPNKDEPKKRNYDRKKNLKRSLNKVIKEMERGRDYRVPKMRRPFPSEPKPEPKVSSFMDTFAQTLKDLSAIKPGTLTTVLNFLGFDSITSLLPLLMSNNVENIIGNFGGMFMNLANSYDADDSVNSFVGITKGDALDKCKKIYAELFNIDLDNFTNEELIKKVGEMVLDKEKQQQFIADFQPPNQKIADLIRLLYLISVGPEKYAEDVNKDFTSESITNLFSNMLYRNPESAFYIGIHN